MERSNDDDEAFEPHPDVHKNREDEDNDHARANALEPEQLRADDVATDHRPISPPIRTEGAVLECVEFVRIAAVPGDEELHAVGVTDDRTGSEDHLAHEFNVPNGYNILQPAERSQGNEQREHHAKPGEDRTGN